MITKNGKDDRAPDLDDLIVRTGQGDRAAFEELYRRMSAPVFTYALSLLRNVSDAQDVLQDVFLSLYDAAPEYEARGKGRSFIMTIANNRCLMLLRAGSMRCDAPEEGFFESIGDASSLTPYENALLSECLSRLDEDERRIVLLHALSGMKHREIASLLRLPLGSVLSKYNRAIKRLRSVYGDKEET